MNLANLKTKHFVVGKIKGKHLLAIGTMLASGVSALYLLLWQAQVSNIANAAPTPLIVTSTADTTDTNPGDDICDDGTGNCTLRAAITEANADTDADTIHFNIPDSDPNHLCYADDGVAGSVDPTLEEATTTQDACSSGSTIDPDHGYSWFRFVPTDAMGQMQLRRETHIDGYTQPGSFPNSNPTGGLNGVLKIEVDGAGHGTQYPRIFRLRGTDVNWDASSSVIKGLVLNNTVNGIAGGTGSALELNDSLTDVKIQGNYIGTDISGLTEKSNNGQNIFITTDSSNNIIGVDGDGVDDEQERNILSAVTDVAASIGVGIRIGGNSVDNTIAGNLIGTDKTGDSPLGNVGAGVYIDIASSDNIIGTNGDGVSDLLEGNIISGNGDNGVTINNVGSDGNIIAGNMIGTNSTGTASLGNGQAGVRIAGGPINTIIGSNADGSAGESAEGNIISGNLYGVIFQDVSSSVLAGNVIGLNADGSAAIPNSQSGVFLQYNVTDTLVGGVTSDARNVISGNIGSGIAIRDLGGDTNSNYVQGNYIGTDVNGTAAVPNTGVGLLLQDGASTNLIGTDGDGIDDALEGNVISGNGSNGIHITDTGTDANIVAGNYIGIDATGTTGLGNTSNGIYILNAHDTIIGTDSDGIGDVNERNVIAANGVTGVSLHTVEDTTVAGNYVGVNAAGTTAIMNDSNGVALASSSTSSLVGSNLDGVRDDIERNVIVSYASGILSNLSSGNSINGNYVGTDYTGVVALGGAIYDQIKLQTASANNEVKNNVTAAGDRFGIRLLHDGTDNNHVAGNIVGLNAAGTAALPNTSNGIQVDFEAANNIIGTDGDGVDDAQERNIVSGNALNGIRIAQLGTDNNTVAGNYIGTDITGLIAIPNSENGVEIEAQAENNIVGTNGDGSAGDADEGNVISGNGMHGVALSGSGTDGNTIAGNYIGTNASGTAALGNAESGVIMSGSVTNTTVGTNADGTSDAQERNVISGNMHSGVAISSSSDISVAGNYIGVTADGSSPLGNARSGVYLTTNASDNTIGTNADGAYDQEERNIISGNGLSSASHDNVLVTGTATNNTIAGNYIGLDATGVNDVESDSEGGVRLTFAATGNTLGGTDAAARNYISGNSNAVSIFSAATNNQVIGNSIGLNVNGDIVGNTQNGVRISTDATDNIIGGLSAAEANTIVGSVSSAIQILAEDTDNNAFLSNIIHSNAKLAIDHDGYVNSLPDVNDYGDTDTGANDGLNYPIVLNNDSMTTTNPSIAMYLDLDVTETADFIVQLYDNPSGLDSPGHGEGEVLIDTQSVTGVTAGGMSTTLNFNGTISSPDNIALTITEDLGGGDYGSTSEFSSPHEQYINGRVFEDTFYSSTDDGNATDPGYDGVTIDIYHDDGDDNFDAATDRLVYQTTTASIPIGIGAYSALVPSAGDYWIDITDTAAVLPATHNPTGPEVAAASATPITTGDWTLGFNTTLADTSFGYTDPTADPDGDNLDNQTELTLGTDPSDADTDDDGLSDRVEDTNQNGAVDTGETDPNNPDTDGDTLTDGVETGNTSPVADPDGAGPLQGTDTTSSDYQVDTDPSTTTDPLLTDTDTDSLSDSTEDTNQNGAVDTGETDPNNPDTDGDTLTDDQEDSNSNGTVDVGETDPTQADTDGDGDNDNIDICPLDQDNNCDGDNIPTATEDAGPNSGDANNDGTPDSQQASVATAPNTNSPTSSSSDPAFTALALDTTTTTCGTVSNLGFVDESSLASQDEDYQYPVGLFDFTVACTDSGDTATITYILDTEYDTSDWNWRKYNPATNQYSDMSSQVTYNTANIAGTNKTTASFQVTDGSSLDDDATVNATILDPSGPAIEVEEEEQQEEQEEQGETEDDEETAQTDTNQETTEDESQESLAETGATTAYLTVLVGTALAIAATVLLKKKKVSFPRL